MTSYLRKTIEYALCRSNKWNQLISSGVSWYSLDLVAIQVVYCSLTDFQQTVYQAVLDTDDVTLLLQSSAKCQCGSGRPRKKCCFKANADGVPVRNLYFSYLAILRKVANHVALLQSREGTSKKQVNNRKRNIFTQAQICCFCKHFSYHRRNMWQPFASEFLRNVQILPKGANRRHLRRCRIQCTVGKWRWCIYLIKN